jgi:hypothetical protein
MEDKKNKVYRIVENNFYERGEIKKGYTRYHVEVQKKFLWYEYWSSIKEPNYDHQSTIEFNTMEEAQELVDKLKNVSRINGWVRKVVSGDPQFEKI